MRLLAAVDERIDAHSYPATAAELAAEYDDVELELPNGEETLGDAFGRLGDATLAGPEDARLAAYSAVSKGAIGRANYSDRDSPSIGGTGPDPVSF